MFYWPFLPTTTVLPNYPPESVFSSSNILPCGNMIYDETCLPTGHGFQVVLVAIVTWMHNCSTTVHEKFLHVDLSSTFHQKKLTKAETWICSSSGWKSSTHKKSWSIGWARFFFFRNSSFKGRNLKVLMCFYRFCLGSSLKKLK